MDVMTPYVPAVELIYRSLAQPKPAGTEPSSVEAPPAIELTRADVDLIIHRECLATPEELQEIIARAKDYKLTDGERNQLGVDLSICVAQCGRQINGRREDPSARFIRDLGYALTPFGLLPERAWFQTVLQTATKAIAVCRRHLPAQCSSWKEARENLYSVRQSFEEKSPESWAALRVWEALEEIEPSSRPERTGIAE
jgi:hypothetical protein